MKYIYKSDGAGYVNPSLIRNNYQTYNEFFRRRKITLRIAR